MPLPEFFVSMPCFLVKCRKQVETRNVYRCLVGKRIVKRQLGSFIKMTLREVGYEVGKWMSPVEDRA